MQIERRIRNIVALVVVVSYVLVGAIGFWDVLGQMFHSGTHPTIITKGNPPGSQQPKVVWTQQKHYPSSSKDNVPTPALVSDRPAHHFQEFSFAVSPPFVILSSSFHPHEDSPRAPPFLL
jgi:hypothetical protein